VIEVEEFLVICRSGEGEIIVNNRGISYRYAPQVCVSPLCKMVVDAVIGSKKFLTHWISSIRKVILARWYEKALLMGSLIYAGISC
jgi:hypothetical protein